MLRVNEYERKRWYFKWFAFTEIDFELLRIFHMGITIAETNKKKSRRSPYKNKWVSKRGMYAYMDVRVPTT